MKLTAACLALALALPALARAQTALPVLAAQPAQIKIDGDVAEWKNARFVRLGDDPSGSAEVALAHDADGLFIGARVRDDVFVRSARPRTNEDALIVRLALPQRGQFIDCELWLFAGKIGESAASAQLKTSAVPIPLRGAKIVEGPSPGGYALEAFVPWASVPGGSDWHYARGAVRLRDVDADGPRSAAHDPSSAAWTLPAAELPYLALEGGPVQAVTGLLRSKNLERAASKLDAFVDVRGDARLERVLVIGTFVAVSGTGAQFDFADLPVRAPSDVLNAELRELTGDTKPELVVRLQQSNELGRRELLAVYRLSAPPVGQVFGAELRKETGQGFITALSRFERAARGPTQIVLSIGRANGLSEENYSETREGDLVPIALPWGTWLERRYAWDGAKFALRSEVPAEAHAEAANAPSVADGPAPAIEPQEAPLEAYKRQRNIAPGTAPRFAQSSNVTGDARPEALAVYGRELVITGADLGGAGFFYLGLPVADAGDVLGVQTGDLTGDGRRELLVRVRQRIGDVSRELVYCYSLGQQRAEQLLVVEVARARGTQRIDNKVALVADKQRAVLTIEPGVARGWSAADYPFVAESADGIAPLLLPWKDRVTSYVYERDRLVPKATTSN
ncbi:MAG TPA: hypothetical protein VJR89_25410 [Polyangiales bacterium]|nr:hypothetical protein [Polyangiales bacterium]